jgi:hypothetical protein
LYESEFFSVNPTRDSIIEAHYGSQWATRNMGPGETFQWDCPAKIRSPMLTSNHLTVAELERLFPGDSEMAGRMRGLAWAASDFGPVENWPTHLRIAVRLCLTSRFPILLWWGPKLCLLYNDAYLPWLTEAKHPRALGRPGHECWSEIWDVIRPMMEGVLSTGQATWSVDTELFFNRKVHKEEVYITWTYAPILAADGKTVDGIFNPCVETTEKVVGARRQC